MWAFFGSTSQPFAYPLTRLPFPRSWPSTEAIRPRLWLSPSTSQNGLSAPVTCSFMFVRPEDVTSTFGEPPVGAVDAAAGTVPRAERERRTAGFGTEHDPVEVDARVDTERRPQDVLTALERERATTMRHRWPGRTALRSADGPPPRRRWIRSRGREWESRRPSRRSSRHVPGSQSATAGRCTPGMPSSASAAGITIGVFE